MGKLGGELKLSEVCEVEYEWEIVDESFSHEFGIHRVLCPQITSLTVHHYILGDWFDVTHILDAKLKSEIECKILERLDPYINGTFNHEYNGDH